VGIVVSAVAGDREEKALIGHLLVDAGFVDLGDRIPAIVRFSDIL